MGSSCRLQHYGIENRDSFCKESMPKEARVSLRNGFDTRDKMDRFGTDTGTYRNFSEQDKALGFHSPFFPSTTSILLLAV